MLQLQPGWAQGGDRLLLPAGSYAPALAANSLLPMQMRHCGLASEACPHTGSFTALQRPVWGGQHAAEAGAVRPGIREVRAPVQAQQPFEDCGVEAQLVRCHALPAAMNLLHTTQPAGWAALLGPPAGPPCALVCHSLCWLASILPRTPPAHPGGPICPCVFCCIQFCPGTHTYPSSGCGCTAHSSAWRAPHGTRSERAVWSTAAASCGGCSTLVWHR